MIIGSFRFLRPGLRFQDAFSQQKRSLSSAQAGLLQQWTQNGFWPSTQRLVRIEADGALMVQVSAPLGADVRTNELPAPPGMANFSPMRVIDSLAAMQRQALRWKRQGVRIGFVPTMGYLHEGHLSLVQEARRRVGRRGIVVVSIYVNPTQFAPTEDLAKYPRDFTRDRALCRTAGADVIFFPNDAEMYPGKAEGRYSTYVVEESLSESMEGASRPAHFRGVTTVVAKLFNVVLPHVAVFGAKDWQQAAVIQRMTRDLNFPVDVVVAPTVRESDGLAMSSRNKYLVGPLRAQAVALSQAIVLARQVVSDAKRPVSASALQARLKKFIERQPDARVDYLAFFDPETLQPVTRVTRETHMALAVFVGQTRLIDNAGL